MHDAFLIDFHANKQAGPVARMVFAPTLWPLHSTPGQTRPGPTRPDQTRPDQTRDSAIVWVHKFSKRDTRKPDEPSVACVAFLASSSTLHSSPLSFPPWPILCLCKCLCVILVVVDLRFC